MNSFFRLILLVDPVDPSARAIGEAKFVVHQTPRRNQNAEVATFVAIVAFAGDAQEKSFRLIFGVAAVALR